MNDAAGSRYSFFKRPAIIYLIACLIVIAVVCCRAHQWDLATRTLDRNLWPQWSPPFSGSRLSQRFFLDNDPYYWISYARQMVETGTWRVRYTYADNVPFGREVHWSQSVMWLLVGFGYVRHLFTGENMYLAIEGASIWVNPFLLLVFTVGFSWLISRRMGVAAGTFFALTFATTPDIDWVFHAFRLGHHGLQVASSMGAVLCLVLGGLGWVAKSRRTGSTPDDRARLRFFRPLELPGQREARGYFLLAGVFTGLGLWIGATVQFFTIGAIALGAVMLAFFMPAQTREGEIDYVPGLWRVWGGSASLVGLAFYLIEYFPSHLSLRLEVNNPLYLFGVFCVGDLMYRLTRRRLRQGEGRSGDYLKIAVAAAGVAAVPLAFLLGPVQWHSLRDIEMSRLHNFILEFYTYLNFSRESPLKNWFTRSYGILPFFLVGALTLTGPRRTTLYEWAALWISFFLSVFTLLLTLWQIRWAGLHAAMIVWLMIVVGHIAWRNVLGVPARNRRLGTAIVISGLVLVQGIYFSQGEFSNLIEINEGKTTPKEFIDAAMKKHLAEGLRAQSQGKPLRILCEADLAPALYYFGGIQTVDSLYWENLAGLHDATAFFTDQGDVVAQRIARERGLTHVIVSGSETLPTQFNYIATGDMNVADAQSTLLARLGPKRNQSPLWLKLDQNLTAVGRREFNLRQNHGVASLHSLMTVYRIEISGTD